MHRDQIIRKLKDLKTQFETFHVVEVFLFGSAAREETTEGSDIDLLINFSPDSHVGLFGLARLQKVIQDTFNCKVDLVTRDALHPALREKILREAINVT
ncbi:MAG: nucleotidyltransferase family protein [Proteobacteria bacterium]|nr:nucleotidyltransferase family protein [Pseudomonadota bacterium]MBU1715454.1 nucleotidyltransferase family protein [Pseudomonadota bacterium]